MKELHIKIGDKKRFLHQLQHALKKKKLEKKEESNGMVGLYGMPVILNKYMPKDRAVLIDANGKVIQVYKL